MTEALSPTVCRSPLHCSKEDRCVVRYSAFCFFYRLGIFADKDVRREMTKALGLPDNFTRADVDTLASARCSTGFTSSALESSR